MRDAGTKAKDVALSLPVLSRPESHVAGRSKLKSSHFVGVLAASVFSSLPEPRWTRYVAKHILNHMDVDVMDQVAELSWREMTHKYLLGMFTAFDVRLAKSCRIMCVMCEHRLKSEKSRNKRG